MCSQNGESAMTLKDEIRQLTDPAVDNVKTVKKVTRHVSCIVEISPKYGPYSALLPPSRREAYELNWYRDWANEIKEFLRDHRHLDVESVDVVHKTQDVCSSCGGEWDLMVEDGKTYCSWCGQLAEGQE